MRLETFYIYINININMGSTEMKILIKLDKRKFNNLIKLLQQQVITFWQELRNLLKDFLTFLNFVFCNILFISQI